MRNFMTYLFVYEFMYMKNIVKSESYLTRKWCGPRFQMRLSMLRHHDVRISVTAHGDR